MEKAFDKVEWEFIEAILHHYGFLDRVIGLILKCLNTVTIRFNINGTISDSIVPSRGIRQGDPLSPYLFLLCSKGLSAAFRLGEKYFGFKGISISRNATPVSHLFLADDFLIFSTASQQACRSIREAFDIYKLATG
uniref:Reverse transcriptase domain-containing protein n=1 Tax=Cannabis sativa TaxID=3483 RepID=A0A803QDN8_CANSA